MIATTSKTTGCLGAGLVLLVLVGAGLARAERLAHARFEVPAGPDSWVYRVGYPEGIARSDQATSARREDGRWVLRMGTTTSRCVMEVVDLRAVHGPVLSWVFRVERARWNDDAYAEIRVRAADGRERRLWRWGATELRAAKAGRGNFQQVALPVGWESAEILLEGRASAARGSAWFDVFDLRVDATPAAVVGDAAPQWERPPYLQWVGTASALVQWRTRYPRRATLRWGPDASSPLAERWDSAGAETEHAVRLDALEPDTRYRYEITLDERLVAAGPSYSFVSAPSGRSLPDAPDASIGIWVIGDSGKCGVTPKGCQDSAAVRDAMARVSAGRPPALWFLLGDNAYPHGSDWQYSEALFRNYARRAAATILWPAPGNHDFHAADSATQSGAYFDAFTLPSAGEAGGVASGTEAYYSFDWGPAHVVVLDSHDSDRAPDAPMATWLEADLRQAGDPSWTIAMFHHPPYSHGSHDSDHPEDSTGRMVEMREVFVPILERHGVDLVLAGHSHGYERSGLIRGHTGHSRSYQEAVHRIADGDGAPPYPYTKGREGRGTVYVVVGSSSEASHNMKPHPVMVKSLATLGSLWIEVRADSLLGRFVDAEARILDEFEIHKRGTTASPGTVALIVSALILLGAALAALWAGRRRV